jgi:glycine/D-amino acid oxidase-like deaminating enzyme
LFDNHFGLEMSYSIAVVGAGWYGCHIATSLQALGLNVTVFEKAVRPLHEASGNNQFRLHQGFHYPRHYATRMQSRDGFLRFIERYPHLSREVPENIYAVPRRESLVDFLTYRLVMTSSGIDFTELQTPSVGLCDIEGALLVAERVVMLERARAYFKRRLGASLVLDAEVASVEETERAVFVNGARFDFLIDATWGHRGPLPVDVTYEPTLLLYYECAEDFPALTLVDGPLCSVYPTEDPRVYTLSSVPYTPLGRFPTAPAARLFRDRVDGNVVEERRRAMERQIRQYLPDFAGRFKFLGPQISLKTKPLGMHDDRSCYVFRQGRVFSVLSGKIDTIFFAVERILGLLEALDDSEFDGVGSSLRADTEQRMKVLISDVG